KPQWLLLKERDTFASKGGDAPVTQAAPPPKLADFHPQLATLEDRLPVGDEWVVEPKLDGYRALARLENHEVELVSRNGKDWRERFPNVVRAIEKLPISSAVLDGEICVLDDQGVPRFQLLQNSLEGSTRRKVAARTPANGKAPADEARLVYFVFDLLFVDGKDLRDHPLSTRKSMLESILSGQKPPLIYVPHVTATKGAVLLEAACASGAEGVVVKRLEAPHRPRRTPEWVKVKCGRRQEAIIVGFSAPKGSRESLGALLLGVNDGDGIQYAGKVGTGFDARTLKDLARRLKPLIVKQSPVVNPPRVKDVTWVKPALVAEVAFAEWTSDGSMRHPSFVGLRDDKKPAEVHRELPAHAPTEAKSAAPGAPKKRKETSMATSKATPRTRDGKDGIGKKTAARRTATNVGGASRRATPSVAKAGEEVVNGVRISHPGRVIDSKSGVTKLDLAKYYAAISERIMPYITGRPLALVRCPEGDQGECFFQKRRTPGMSDSVHEGNIAKNPILYVDDEAGLLSLVQFGAVELHAWGCRVSDPEHPDWIVMDLDPAPELDFARTLDAAEAVKESLASIGLASFAKTTGGKGLHVVAPIVPHFDFDAIKELTHALAERLAKDAPKLYTSVMSKKSRTEKVFVDYLRNGQGATAIAPYAVRARPGSTVASPLGWDELRNTNPNELTVKTVPAFLKARKSDPWARFSTMRQEVPAALADRTTTRRSG
ncbi:MAG TPA: DNA ligase D, partial [Polyangiaceae bacterium]|nr:DNA ligase D [Polyangiaceae bacterium]